MVIYRRIEYTSLGITILPIITRAKWQAIQITDIQKESIIGHLLEDGYITKTSGKMTNARFNFAQSCKKKDYFLQHHTNYLSLCKPHTTCATKFFITGASSLSSMNFLKLPCLNEYFYLFYKEGQKQVPTNICELLTAQNLAY